MLRKLGVNLAVSLNNTQIIHPSKMRIISRENLCIALVTCMTSGHLLVEKCISSMHVYNMYIFINDRNRTRVVLTWVLRCSHVNNTANPNRP